MLSSDQGSHLLVAGGAGFIGSHVIKEASRRAMKVTALVRETTDLRRLPGGVPIITVDASESAEFAQRLRDHDFTDVVNCLSAPSHHTVGSERVTAWRDDLQATIGLLESLRWLDVRLAHVSSSLVYAPSSRPHREGDPVKPPTARGACKAATEIAVSQWAQETSHRIVIVRPFSVYGPREPSERVVPALLAALADRKPFAFTAADAPRDFVFVGDVASAILDSLDRPSAHGKTINLGTGIETTTKQLATLAQEETGLTLIESSDVFEARAADRPHWRADPTLAKKLLSWTPIGLREGIARTWAEGR